VITPFVIWVGQWMLGLLLGHSSAVSGPPRPAVIIGLTEVGLRLAGELETNTLLHTKVLGFFEDREMAGEDQRLPVEGLDRIIGKSADLATFIKDNGVQHVYITLPMTRHPRIMALFESLRDTTASVYFVPDLYAFAMVQARFDSVGDVPVLAVCDTPFVGASSLAKRMFDILLSGTAIVLLSPVLLVVAIIVKATSPGPALFKQQRYGLDGGSIKVFKFRSMSVTEDGHSSYKQVTRNDARVTPFGAFIRKTSLDELPQLFNVFSGTMSVVGPRPHVVAVNETYRKLIPGYMIRHKVKPGITGWAQVNGARGGDDLEAMRRRIEYDLEYLRNWSLALDISILLRTVAVVFRDRNAY
jgi:putative colanic acid biosynthesis UDP-glucose lipid carrier transferase